MCECYATYELQKIYSNRSYIDLNFTLMNIMSCQWACKIAILQKYNLAQKSFIELNSILY